MVPPKVDLEKLKIDRGPERAVARRGRRPSRWPVRLIALAALVGLVWLFHAPLLDLLDRWRLPEVQVASVVRSSPAAAAAARGTAANGYVVARRRAALSADAPGRIVEMRVEEGSVVAEGDVVARLYADELEAGLRRAEAELAVGGRAVEAAATRVAAAERRLEEARAAVAQAEASLQEADAVVGLAEREEARSRGLLEGGVDTAERLDRAEAELAQARARRAAADAAVDVSRQTVARAESDVDVARAEREQAKAALAGLAAARDQAAAALDKTYVRAPFDGIIVLKDAEVGEVVSPNAQGGQSRGSVATMVDFDSLEIQVELPETSLDAARVGAPADVFLDAFPGRRLPGEVERVWPTANRQKATVEVRVGLDEIDPRMRPDMGARVVFLPEDAPPEPAEAAAADALVVPAGAVVRVGERDGVFVLERDVARFRPVTLGGSAGRRVTVEDGLREGDRVVVEPPPRLADGDRVRIEGGA